MNNRLITLFVLPIMLLFVGNLTQNAVRVDPGSVPAGQELRAEPTETGPHLFATADACMSCHNGLLTSTGEDISFGTEWRTTMMANSARDPYWHAAVRREVMDHPGSKAAIENECSTCHMPMAHYESVYGGNDARVFANLPVNAGASRENILAADGVSCTTCHQITEKDFGTRESFVGRFGIDTVSIMGQRSIFGPYPVDTGLSAIMHSSSGFLQKQSKHIQQSELCATCHTLITHALDPDGEVIGELPEQVPYQEWLHSSFSDRQSCQSCHMPVVQQPAAISSVLGQPRDSVSRHSFLGGNFFMLKMLNRYRNDLGVTALPREMDAAVMRTIDHLQTRTAVVEIRGTEIVEGELRADVVVRNLAGHKLPTAYPSRRVWINFSVSDVSGRRIFESGALQFDGSIAGNDNDVNAGRYEPHYSEITREDQVQIYEAVMADPSDGVTTGLLTAVRFIKDNRILPDGFDKQTADEMIMVHGLASGDEDFTGGSDRIRYRVPLDGAEGPFSIDAQLWYQPIGYRWARNLEPYDSPETNRFSSYYSSMSDQSAELLAGSAVIVN